MGYWKRHSNKDLQTVLEEFHAHGWIVIDPPRYYTLRCPCGLHQRQIHLTPSDPDYGKRALNWGKRQACWNQGEEDK